MWILHYLQHAEQFRKENKVSIPWPRLLRDAMTWRRMRRSKTTPLMDSTPWMTFAAVRFLRKHLQSDASVFEWGMGGSTKFFLSIASQVVSVEHDERWFQNVKGEISAARACDWTAILASPKKASSTDRDPCDPDGYSSSDSGFAGFSFQEYCCTIDAFQGPYNFVVVDGRSRPSCIKHGLAKVKAGGFLVLDNAEREHYQKAKNTLVPSEWTFFDLSGPGPYNEYFWSTWIWQKPL